MRNQNIPPFGGKYNIITLPPDCDTCPANLHTYDFGRNLATSFTQQDLSGTPLFSSLSTTFGIFMMFADGDFITARHMSRVLISPVKGLVSLLDASPLIKTFGTHLVSEWSRTSKLGHSYSGLENYTDWKGNPLGFDSNNYIITVFYEYRLQGWPVCCWEVIFKQPLSNSTCF